MKKKAVFSIAAMLIATSLVSAKNNSILAIDQFAIDQAVKQEITSLVEDEVQQRANKFAEDKNWLRSEPLDYLRVDKNISLAEKIKKLQRGEILPTDITDQREQFDLISYLIVNDKDKETFRNFINKDNWTLETTPLYYFADGIDQGRTLFTQAVLAKDKEAFSYMWENLPGDKQTKQEWLFKTLRSLVKTPDIEEKPYSRKDIKKKLKFLRDGEVSAEELYRYLEPEEGIDVVSIIDYRKKKIKQYEEELRLIDEIEKATNDSTGIGIAYFVIDGNIRALKTAEESFQNSLSDIFNSYSKIDKLYLALEYLIDYKSKNIK